MGMDLVDGDGAPFPRVHRDDLVVIVFNGIPPEDVADHFKAVRVPFRLAIIWAAASVVLRWPEKLYFKIFEDAVKPL
jgi:hypothetical protein